VKSGDRIGIAAQFKIIIKTRLAGKCGMYSTISLGTAIEPFG